MSGDTLRDERDPGFYIIDNELVDEYGPLIGAYGVAVYNVLARYANRHGENAFPSYNHIAEKLAFSRDTAIKTVKLLVEHKLVRKQPRWNGRGENSSNEYSLLKVKGTKAPAMAPNTPPSGCEQPPPVAVNDHPSGCEQPPLVVVNDHPSRSQRPYKDLFKKTPIEKDKFKEPSSATPANDGSPSTLPNEADIKLVSETLQKVGVGLSAYIVDQYADLITDYGIHATVAGILAAADNHKQHQLKYVSACIRNAAQGGNRKDAPYATNRATNHRNPTTRVAPKSNQHMQLIEPDDTGLY